MPGTTAPASASPTAFSAALATAQTDGTERPDFTDMSRQALRDWVNGRIRSGEMSLDESRPFMAMGMKIAVDGNPGGEVPAVADGTRYDFVQKMRAGMAHAQARNDHATQAMLAAALQTMQRHQG